MIVEKA